MTEEIEEVLAEDIEEYLEDRVPEEIQDNLEVVGKTNDNDRFEIDIEEVLNVIPLAYTRPAEVTSYLLKIRQGICNMAYSMEDYYDRTEDAFRVWKAELSKQLNYKDERNPLVVEGSKTTNKAIKSHVRSQDDYEEYKNKMSEIKAAKQMMWSAKKTVDQALEVVANIRKEVHSDDFSVEDLEDEERNFLDN